MLRAYLFPLLAAAGMVFAVYSVIVGNRPLPAAPPVSATPHAPYEHYVAGAGLVEALSENIAVGTLVAGVVAEVQVKVGTTVKLGDALFRIDSRDLAAERLVRESEFAAARARHAQLVSQPRSEELPLRVARVDEARAALADARDEYEMWTGLPDKRAVSAEALSRRKFATEAAAARLVHAESELKLLAAGAWAPDLAVAQADVDSAAARLRALEIEIDRRTVRAPIAGTVLQLKIRVGEYAPAGALATPLLLLGDLTRLVVRIDIDENDAWRVKSGANARSFVRGNSRFSAALRFERIEPFVIPKRSLTGESTERVDTRVLQVLYSFDRTELPVYVGQQLDVYIEAQPITPNETAAEKMDGGR
ncbi:MAG: HlyD family secretion protein [Planctomycetota bacterium]